MRTIRPNNKFVVFTNAYLATSDFNVLNLLYKPIIGLDALEIYSVIRRELSLDKLLSDPKNHSHILVDTNLSMEEFIANRQKLEAIGLLRSYEDFRNNLLTIRYEVNKPLSPNRFFMNPSTNKLLHKTIGHEGYHQLKESFKVSRVDVSQLNNITMKFDQVFNCNVNEQHHKYLTNGDRFADKNKSDIKYHESDFSVEKLLQKACRIEVPSQVMSKEFIAFIVDTANTYGVSEPNIARFIKMSIVNGRADRDFIIQSAEVWAGQSATKVEKKFNIDDIKDDELLEIAKHLDAISFLKYLYNGLTPSKRDRRLINEAIRDYRLNDEVINILTYVSLVENDHRLSKEYYFFVATQWSRKGFKTAEAALKQYKLTTKNRKVNNIVSNNKPYKQTKQSSIEIPQWYNKDIEKKKPEKEAEDRIKNMLNKW